MILKQYDYSKNYDELAFTDDFMFGKVMEDPDICHDVLECLLGQPVGELSDVESQREFRHTSDGKPIRIDIYTKDDKAVYDAEMQNKGHNSIKSLDLAKRSRFYQSSIDTDFLNRSESYANLPDSYVLFICTFDPFGMGLSRYTFRNRCDECLELTLGDNATICFYNCSYEGDDIPQNIREFYNYVINGDAKGVLSDKLSKAVGKARLNEKWRSAYMKERALFMDLRREGREEGLAAGRTEGREEALISIVCKKLRKGMSASDIADILEEDESKISAICETAAKYAPDYDVDKILEELGIYSIQ